MLRRISMGLVLFVLLVCGLGLWFLSSRTEGEYFDAAGVRLHYTEEGSGEPLILIHGFVMDADLEWRMSGLTDHFAQSYRVIAIDNRGHGLSDRPLGAGAYGLEMVRDVLRLMDHLDIERARVVGYSMGGMITMKLLNEHPERVQRAVVGGTGWLDSELDIPINDFANAMDERDFSLLISSLRPPDATSSVLGDWVVSAVFGLMSIRNDPVALGSVVRGFPKLAVTEAQLRRNQVPTLVVVGTRDPMKSMVERLDGVMQKASLVYVEGGDHGSTKRSDHFRDALTSFLAAGD